MRIGEFCYCTLVRSTVLLVPTPSFRFTTGTPSVLAYWSHLYSIHGLVFLKKLSLPTYEYRECMREQRMIKPCMQRFDKALTYEHVNVRDYNLVLACNSHTYTWTQKHVRRPNACMSEHTSKHTR